MEIREAHPDEHAALGALMVRVYASIDGFPRPDEQPAYYDVLANVGRLASRPGIELVVAVDEARLLGGVVYLADLEQYGAGTVAVEPATSAFRLLAVDPDARGFGVGKALVNACIERARQRGHRQLIIHTTRAQQVAWGMYERMGFRRSEDLDFLQDGFPIFGFRLGL